MAGAGVSRPVLVVGVGAEKVREAFGDRFVYAEQGEALGTGHAALAGLSGIEGFEGPVFVSAGDTPLLTSELFLAALEGYRAGNAVTVITAKVPDPNGYGRILRREGRVVGIAEDKVATDEQKRIDEINASIYCVDAAFLRDCLPNLRKNEIVGEILLTDIVAEAVARGLPVEGIVRDELESRGVNDRVQLAEATAILKDRVLRKHMHDGVTILDPATTTIGLDVEIGPDTVIEPCTQILGKTRIGSFCRIGPSTLIDGSDIGDRCIVFMSRVSEARMEEGSKCGPFANLRPGAHLCTEAKVGNFVEIKNSILGDRVAVSHLSYVGDAEVGRDTNIGAGTITCNYDGFRKSRTFIGERVFVGSNSTLVAPLRLGDGAMTAAGSVVVSGEYEGNSLIIGRSRTKVKPEWAAQWRNRNTSKTESKDGA
jgi:bifunctional UDP-N-acetylglucosamine pyrophosphorylase/glucosamine-1-phosphate N-acetyltransferase